jgi:glycosyltransferase involved in cell wall biosynthesis
MLTYQFYPDIGGVEIAVLNFARVLTEFGNQVHVIVPLKEGQVSEETISGIPIHRFPFNWDDALAALLQNERSNEFREKATDAIKIILEGIGGTPIIHAHGEAVVAGAWLKSQLKRIKLVYTPHASPVALKELLETKFFGPLHFQPALEKTDLIAYHSINLLSELVGLGIPREKIRDLVNFIDPVLFNPLKYSRSACKEELKLPAGSKILFSPSRIDEEKGIVELVRTLPLILEEHSDVHLYLAGDLADGFILNPSDVHRKILRKTRKLLPNHSDRVHFTGAISYSEMPKWYKAADIVVLPSRDECLPMCLLEAMAMEKLIVATNVGGIPAILDNRTSRLINISKNRRISPKEAATVINQALSQYNPKDPIFKQLRRRVLAEFSPEVGYQKLQRIYSEVSSL